MSHCVPVSFRIFKERLISLHTSKNRNYHATDVIYSEATPKGQMIHAANDSSDKDKPEQDHTYVKTRWFGIVLNTNLVDYLFTNLWPLTHCRYIWKMRVKSVVLRWGTYRAPGCTFRLWNVYTIYNKIQWDGQRSEMRWMGTDVSSRGSIGICKTCVGM